MYDNRSERGGRPNIDEVVMVKLLVLQQCGTGYNSDPELERQAVDRLSFMKLSRISRGLSGFYDRIKIL
jgi:IS5 family transposase